MKPRKKSKPSKKATKPDTSQTHVEITSKSFHVSAPLKQLILEKSEHLPASESIHVVLTSHKEKQGTEVHIVVSMGKETLQTRAHNANAYTAVINAFKKIRTMANKHDLKQKDRTRHCHSLAEEEALSIEKEGETMEDEWLPFSPMDAWDSLKNFGYVPSSERKKISKKKTAIRMLSEEEAIHKLESSDDTALVFLNEQEHKIQCVYKHQNGNYVLIDPIHSERRPRAL